MIVYEMNSRRDARGSNTCVMPHQQHQRARDNSKAHNNSQPTPPKGKSQPGRRLTPLATLRQAQAKPSLRPESSSTKSGSVPRIKNPKELQSLLEQLISTISTGDVEGPELTEADNFLDWIAENLPKGMSWLVKNVAPHLPALLALL